LLFESTYLLCELDVTAWRTGHSTEAGADVIFVEAPQSVEELRMACEGIKAPLMVNMVENGKTPLLTVDQLQAMGFSVAIYPVSLLFAATKAMLRVAKELKTPGTTALILEEFIPFTEFSDFIGLPYYNELERKFALNGT
jgi:2-methylisocitrate lyase-like PEP mutase family enzyme